MRIRTVTAVLIALAVAAATGTSTPAARALPNFSGQWVLESAKPLRAGYEQFWLGTEARIAQEPTRLTIARVSPAPERTATFTLDGAENQNKYVVGGAPIVRDSRATWNGESLLISTDTTTADGYRWLSNILRWSLDPDGTLVIGDTEICGKGECPSVITALRFRKK